MADSVRIMVVEDNEDLRTTLTELLDAEPDVDCVAATGQLGEIVHLVRSSAAQVVILDIELQGGSSLLRLPELRRQLPDAHFIIHSGHSQPMLIKSALDAGAAAYVLKSGDLDDLLAAIRRCVGIDRV